MTVLNRLREVAVVRRDNHSDRILLGTMLAVKGPDRLYQEMVSRLGKGQARALAMKYRKG